MDRIRLIPDQLFLTDEAAHRNVTTDGFERRVISRGKDRPQSMILSLANGHHNLLRAICHRLSDGRWRIGCIDLNLPSLVHGHNGRPLVSDDDLSIALTRLNHFLRKITTPDCHGRLITGVGPNNLGFVHYLEAMIQIQDPGHRLLRASHVGRLPYQQKAPLVCWGESTRFRSRESDLSLYDKHAQRRHGHLVPPGIPGVRIESVLKKPERIARELVAIGSFDGSKGEVASTVSLTSSYALIRHGVCRLSGWSVPVAETLSALPGPARLLVLGLGDRIAEPYAVDEIIDRYRETCNPCDRTLRGIVKGIRGYATSLIKAGAVAALPLHMESLAVSEVRQCQTEADYKSFLVQWEAPSVPAPAISEAWSVTTLLPRRPDGIEIIGRTSPQATMPWRQTI